MHCIRLMLFLMLFRMTVSERLGFEYLGTNSSGQYLANTAAKDILGCARSCPSAESQVQGCKALSFNSEENACKVMLSLNQSSADDILHKWRTFKLRSCVDGWLFWSGSCYKIYTEIASWTVARQNCKNVGAYLTALETTEEAHFVWAKVAHEQTGNVFLGGRDMEEENVWRWEDEDDNMQNDILVPLGNSSSGWRDGEPNNTGEEDC